MEASVSRAGKSEERRYDLQKWLIALLFVISGTTAINSTYQVILNKRLNKIEERYVTTEVVNWLYSASQAETKNALLYMRKDSASTMRAHEEIAALRGEMFKMMMANRGGDGGTNSGMQ